jgi:LysM repeat protein
LLLVAVMVGAVVVVFLVRPLIFDEIVPAVLGWEPPPAPGETPAGADVTPTLTPTATPAVLTTTTPIAPDGPAGPATPTATATTSAATATPQVYFVVPGDNLTKIARRYGVSVQAIVNANNIANPNRIMPGDRLIIP